MEELRFSPKTHDIPKNASGPKLERKEKDGRICWDVTVPSGTKALFLGARFWSLQGSTAIHHAVLGPSFGLGSSWHLKLDFLDFGAFVVGSEDRGFRTAEFVCSSAMRVLLCRQPLAL